MQPKNHTVPFFLILTIVLGLTACGPADPVLGLGPVLDQFVGLLLVVALVVGGFWVVRAAGRSPTGRAIVREVSGAEQRVRDHFDSGRLDRKTEQESRAEEILRERYARGEIDRTQYLQMLDDLQRK